MKRLYIIGDLHFGDHKDWDNEAFNKFITWFEEYEFGDPQFTELIQLGDVVEKASNLGNTIELVTRFFKIAAEKFNQIFIIGGNHDHRLVNEKSQYATQYLPLITGRYTNQIKLIFKEEIFYTHNGFHIVALPYRRVEGKVLDDYYSNELPGEFYNAKADLLCGHVAVKEPKTFYGGININKFKTKTKAFGHIHTRNGTYKDLHCGSIMPFKIDETKTELPRVIKKIEEDNNKYTYSEIEIPNFIQHETLQFGDIPQYKKWSDDVVHLYTVNNCKSVQQAKSEYPDIYVKGIEKIQNVINIKTGEKAEIFISPLDALSTLIKDSGLILKRKTLSLLKTLLENE